MFRTLKRRIAQTLKRLNYALGFGDSVVIWGFMVPSFASVFVISLSPLISTSPPFFAISLSTHANEVSG